MATIRGDGRNNELNGGVGNDKIFGLGGNDELDGNGGNDTLEGGKGNDELSGDQGNDSLLGGSGNDDLDGGAGNDVLKGGGGRDDIVGDAGNDQLFGGGGADRFTFDNNDGKDVIGDFKSGSDRIEFDIDNLRFEDLTIVDKGGDAVITWAGGGSNSITLDGVDAASLSRNDFVFDN